MRVIHYWDPIQNSSIWTSNCVERSSRTADLMAVETGGGRWIQNVIFYMHAIYIRCGMRMSTAEDLG